MVEIAAETEIDAAPDTVFDFVAEPANHPKILPSLVEISDVEDAAVGHRGRYVFKMVGQAMEGRFEDSTVDRPDRRVYELSGDIDGTVTWTIEESDDGAHVGYHQDVDVPGPDILESVTEPIAATFLQREADTMMENLKTLVEERPPEAA